MATITDLLTHLEQLRRLVPGFPELTISKPWHIPNSWATESFPHASSPGVYVFSDSATNVIYIGKASFGLGSRIGNEYIGTNGICKSKKVAAADTLYTIPVPEQLFFLSPAIEEFLIYMLRPPMNVVGIGETSHEHSAQP